MIKTKNCPFVIFIVNVSYNNDIVNVWGVTMLDIPKLIYKFYFLIKVLYWQLYTEQSLPDSFINKIYKIPDKHLLVWD